MRKIFKILLLIFFCIGYIFSSGKSLGMGGAYTGISDDIDALKYNIGGLGQLRSTMFDFSYELPFESIDGLNVKSISLVSPFLVKIFANLVLGINYQITEVPGFYKKDYFNVGIGLDFNYFSFIPRIISPMYFGMKFSVTSENFLYNDNGIIDGLLDSKSIKDMTFSPGIMMTVMKLIKIGFYSEIKTDNSFITKSSNSYIVTYNVGASYNYKFKSILDINTDLDFSLLSNMYLLKYGLNIDVSIISLRSGIIFNHEKYLTFTFGGGLNLSFNNYKIKLDLGMLYNLKSSITGNNLQNKFISLGVDIPFNYEK